MKIPSIQKIKVSSRFLLYFVINLDGQGGGEDAGPDALVARGTLATDKSPGEPLVHQEGPRHVLSRGWRIKVVSRVFVALHSSASSCDKMLRRTVNAVCNMRSDVHRLNSVCALWKQDLPW